jgi:hypothetical protein
MMDEHRIYIIGDSHVKGLSDKVRNGLGESFRATSITKPNADIERITCTLHFVQRTANTNAMLLGVPHRYDLPSFSCVNTEVELFNKRLIFFKPLLFASCTDTVQLLEA